MAKRMAGSILATRSSLPQMRLTPTQKIKIEPISERYETASSVRAGASSWGQERDGSLQHEYRDGGEDAALA